MIRHQQKENIVVQDLHKLVPPKDQNSVTDLTKTAFCEALSQVSSKVSFERLLASH
jgi:hypothetical protein